ncbi:TPA: hypothetical protein SMW23_003547, partial [Pseudomonas aeruginosa]|nr:hypothetical protein [Pseudomonas aeruginosa]
MALPTGHLGRRRAVSGTRPVHHLQLRPLHRRGRYPGPGTGAAAGGARHRGETDGTPYQWLDTDAEFEARHVDLRADRDPEAAVRSWLRDAFRHAYPLDGRSLVDLALLHSDQALYVYVRTHHIVSDAWGLQLFLSRVRAGYLG